MIHCILSIFLFLLALQLGVLAIGAIWTAICVLLR